MVQQKLNLKTVEATKLSKILSAKIILKLKKLGAINSIIWDHNDSDSIHVDPYHIHPNQAIPVYLTTIQSFHDSSDNRAIEKILSLPAHLVHTPSPLPAPLIFTYGKASDP